MGCHCANPKISGKCCDIFMRNMWTEGSLSTEWYKRISIHSSQIENQKLWNLTYTFQPLEYTLSWPVTSENHCLNLHVGVSPSFHSGSVRTWYSRPISGVTMDPKNWSSKGMVYGKFTVTPFLDGKIHGFW
jgi:hypothetical protein